MIKFKIPYIESHSTDKLLCTYFCLDIHWAGNWYFGCHSGPTYGDHSGNDASKQAKDL